MLDLITDRTLADVQNKTIKGYYNATDLNRVGEAVQELANLINGYGYSVSVSPKTDWQGGDVGDIPTVTQMAHYLADLAALKAAFYGTTTLPSTMDALTAEQANNIEKLLLEIERNINGMVSAFRHSGATISGMGGLIL